LEPFLKWAGGKRWLAPFLPAEIFDETIEYIEPFAGSAAVFFYHRPSRSILNDMNFKLIATYTSIRDYPEEVFSALRRHQNRHSTDHYYEERARSRRVSHEQAAQFIYLNRSCWNGLYRENLRGEFNVPKGSKDKILWESGFHEYASALSGVSLYSGDFESVLSKARSGSLIFCDPPYTTAHNLNGFVKYNQRMFSWEDQVRLMRAITSADSRGAKFIVTNADHESLRELYDQFPQFRLERQSVISGRNIGRRTTSELIVTNIDKVADVLAPLEMKEGV
jgi:DNA adenine methylase